MKKIKIPKTDSINVLAKFFDTHDSTEFEDDLVEVTEAVFVPRDSILVRLESQQTATLKKLAKAEGISEEELVRKWISQHLAGPNGRAPKRQPVDKRRKE